MVAENFHPQFGFDPDIIHADNDTLFELSLKHSVGDGVDQNNVLAHLYLNLAALRGCERAIPARKELAAEMSDEEIAEAKKVARFIKENFLTPIQKN